MRSHHRILAACAAGILAAAAGWIGGHTRATRNCAARQIAAAFREDVAVSFMVLTKLRGSGPDAAVAGLEGTLDFGIKGAWENRGVLPSREWQEVRSLLLAVKDYRTKFGRGYDDTRPEMRELQSYVDGVLEGLNPER